MQGMPGRSETDLCINDLQLLSLFEGQIFTGPLLVVKEGYIDGSLQREAVSEEYTTTPVK